MIIIIIIIIACTHSSLFFNDSLTEQVNSKTSFLFHVNEKISFLHKIQPILPQASLLTIFNSFMRPHLDYGHVVYNQHSNDAFPNKLETVQSNAALAITGAIKCLFREKSYQELGLENLKQ